MTAVALALVVAPVACFLYAYVAYPAALAVLAWLRPRRRDDRDPAVWPSISVTIPAYNEERSIAATLEALLAADYPAERRQIVVVSDASTDRTDEIVAGYADRGVELLRMPERRGKGAAERAVAAACRGEVIVNLDASIRIPRGSLKALVRVFQDPTIGVASGRDVSVGAAADEETAAESGYVGYEMWVRQLETRLGSIVGASGCFYGTRRELYDTGLPETLDRDFASALIARERGFRAVSVDAAIAFVPRAASLAAEYRRKIRTMARGIRTLWYKRHLLNPFRYGGFALMLFSHKLCRWLVYLLCPTALGGLALLSARFTAAAALLAAAVAVGVLGVAGLRWPSGRRIPAILAIPSFAVASGVAGVLAWFTVLRGQGHVMWEPTRRPVEGSDPAEVQPLAERTDTV
jgi:cellulose synthase/poly-beta-1,6-N-acetylglucosamine synthase-like glycosyltransferase